MKSDIEIAQETALKPIADVARKLGIDDEAVDQYGKYKAKISLDVMNKNTTNGKLVLVTAINPTPAGEGKTTTNVGLSMALNAIGKRSISVLREPSLGPCFGIKGGAAGGGYAQVLPMVDINLHFTGDFHAITSAHNLLAALIDNHLFQGNELNIDPQTITFKRVVDMNDRALRNITIAQDGNKRSVVRESGFDITVASEVMAILCLAQDIDDLKARLGAMIIGFTRNNEPVTAKDLGAVGSMTLLLKEAIKPNLVQTTENTAAIIHGGPFANIAHGCNSVIATQMALKLTDYVVTEAGFGADLGAEKFFDIKCRSADLKPDAVVLVATIRALKYNGGVSKDALSHENLAALEQGQKNLIQHAENLKKFKVPVVIAINRFPADTDAEIAMIRSLGNTLGCAVVLSEVFARGSAGGEELAQAVFKATQQVSAFAPLYSETLPIKDKIETITREIYRAQGVDYSETALKQIEDLTRLGYDDLPICIAKTQYSFSDNPQLLGAPTDFRIRIKELRLAKGAGFIVALSGDIMTMPGLPKVPAACTIDYFSDGTVVGLS